MARRLWSRPGNPPDWVAARLGISREQLGEAIHKVKDSAGLAPSDRVIIWDDGSVTDEADDWIGNIQDEV